MPAWTQYIIGFAALLVALGVIVKFIIPAARLVTTLEKALPMMETLVLVFKDAPNAFKVLYSIQDQFKTDSGSSLRDVVNRIEAAAQEQKRASDSQMAAAEVLKVGVEAVKQVAAVDREQQQKFGIYLDRLGVQVAAAAASTGRIEQHASDVAQDLAASHKRADEVSSGEPGTAADAAAQQTLKEKREDISV